MSLFSTIAHDEAPSFRGITVRGSGEEENVQGPPPEQACRQSYKYSGLPTYY